MSNPGDADATPITSLRQLADHIAAGCKPAEQFRIGTEHEKFGFRLGDLTTPPYEPADGQPGSIRDLLDGLNGYGGTPILDHGNTIGLKQGDAAISLEPAGQLELSGAPLETLHETKAELEAHYDQVRAVSRDLQLGFAPLGFHPIATREQMPWMPKGRYAIMRRYMPLVGTLGLDMMTRTCTVQVNLDYASEQDMVRKLRVSLLLQPLATALFANSPFTEGQPNGYLSYRAHVWTDTDNQRSGIPRVMFEPGFGFERYAEWLVDEVPMYFVYRDGAIYRCRRRIVPRFHGRAAAQRGGSDRDRRRFRRPHDHRVHRRADQALPGNARRRRGPGRHDGGAVGVLGRVCCTTTRRSRRPRRWCGTPPGKMRWRCGPRCRVRAWRRPGAAATCATWRGTWSRSRATDCVRGSGWTRMARMNPIYLDPLVAIAAGEPTQAEHWLARFHQAWQGDVRGIFAEAAI